MVLVVGAGHFGERALRELSRLRPDWPLVAVDRDESVLLPWRAMGVETRLGDALEALDGLLEETHPEWVVPAVPFHLAHSWAMFRLGESPGARRIPVPQDLDLPNPLPAASGDLYTSYATFRCPEHCPEPRGKCFATGERRPVPLFQVLSRMQASGHRVAGLRSRQLGPGVGGYPAAEFRALPNRLASKPGNWLLFTACKCHGVLSGLRVDR
jgi:hypothetical protein